jgi:hypothetical protein
MVMETSFNTENTESTESTEKGLKNFFATTSTTDTTKNENVFSGFVVPDCLFAFLRGLRALRVERGFVVSKEVANA